MLADETYAEDALSITEIGRFLGTDDFGLHDELNDAERDYLRRARACVDNDVLPVINDYWERAEFPWPLIKKMGTLGIVGDGIKGLRLPGDGHCSRGRHTRGGSTRSSTVPRKCSRSSANSRNPRQPPPHRQRKPPASNPNPLWVPLATGRGHDGGRAGCSQDRQNDFKGQD